MFVSLSAEIPRPLYLEDLEAPTFLPNLTNTFPSISGPNPIYPVDHTT